MRRRLLLTLAALLATLALSASALAASPDQCHPGHYGMLLNTYPAIGSLSAVHLPAKTDGVASPCLVVAETIARDMQATWALRKSFPVTVRPQGEMWRAGTFHCAYHERRGEEDPYIRAECHRGRQLVTMDLTS